MSFDAFILENQYKKIRGLGDRLVIMKEIIDWKPFVPIIKKSFYDNNEDGGRPHTDEILIMRILVLQSLYNLTDPELEYQIHDRISFRNFIGFPDKIPDFTTIWRIRDRLKELKIDEKIWSELQRQLNEKGYSFKKGVIQDATFVESDLGKKRYSQEKKAEKDGKEIVYTDKQLQHIDKDAKFAIKNNQIHFGYKSHVKSDVDYHFIREIEVTAANVHDGNVDLCKENDVAMYRDKGYCGKKLKYACVEDKTMIRKDKNKDWVKCWNKSISKIRCVGEMPFSIVKRTFNGLRTFVKSIERVRIKEIFKYFAYNLYHLVTLERKKIAIAV